MLLCSRSRHWPIGVLVAFISTSFISLMLSACGLVGAVSQGTSDCAGRQSGVSIRPASRQELEIGGRKYAFGVFVLSNKTSMPLYVFADISEQKYWMVHPNSVFLQQNGSGSWKDVVGTLSEYSGPNTKVRVPGNEEWQFLYPLDDLLMSGASQTRVFRVVLTDIGRCNISSEPFTLESLGQVESMQ